MPPLNGRETRKLIKAANAIPGPKSLHRGINYHRNQDVVTTYQTNEKAKRADFRDLLVHHQKVNEELQDIFARTAALHKDNMTMEERIEQSWKEAERIGVSRPRARVGFAQHLQTLSGVKKQERAQAQEERATSGETTDFARGSALHNAKDRRIRTFQKRQLKRAHMLRRFGDPTPLKQSGKYDDRSATLNVFHKTVRKVKREVANDERVGRVKEHRGRKGGSVWDLREDNDNVNRPRREVVKSSRDYDVGVARRPAKKRRTR